MRLVIIAILVISFSTVLVTSAFADERIVVTPEDVGVYMPRFKVKLGSGCWTFIAKASAEVKFENGIRIKLWPKDFIFECSRNERTVTITLTDVGDGGSWQVRFAETRSNRSIELSYTRYYTDEILVRFAFYRQW